MSGKNLTCMRTHNRQDRETASMAIPSSVVEGEIRCLRFLSAASQKSCNFILYYGPEHDDVHRGDAVRAQ